MELKKIKDMALSGAVALMGVASFTACSSDESAVDNNPTFDGKNVKTQFAINIPRAASQTRMTAENTQNNDNFLGMKDIRLIPFSTDAIGTGSAIEKIINLPDINTGEISSSQSSKIYNDVNVATGTKRFLFYAVAQYGADGNIKEQFEQGTLNFALDGKTSVNDINVSLKHVTGTPEGQENALLNVLNNVAAAKDDNDKAWSEIQESEEATLAALYKSFTSMSAGSANSIMLLLENLYNVLENYTGNTAYPGLANNIRDAIKNSSAFELENSSSPYKLKYKLAAADEYKWYPRNLGLPDGAAYLAFDDANKKFSFNSQQVIGSPTMKVSSVCFPASLCYYVNTDIRTSADEFKSWPITTTNWIDGTKWKGTWGNEVNATTRTIALKENIQYGVASLKLQVQCATGSLKDKPDTKGGVNQVTVPSAGFPVKGVLIGGQPEKVGFDFKPSIADETGFNKTVYDRTVAIKAKVNVSDGVNYTLVLPNEFNTHQTVNIAIELENTSNVDFRGVDGIVPVGGRFYLIGKLDPNSITSQSKPVNDVFVSDYETTATLTIKSLENAYNNIPDLRSTKMQLGLSVDLKWEDGLHFNVDLGQ